LLTCRNVSVRLLGECRFDREYVPVRPLSRGNEL
jgi:hypothetical protein